MVTSLEIERMNSLIRTDRDGRPTYSAGQAGVCPVYFDTTTRSDPRSIHKDLVELSCQLWTWLGYTGLMTPWHDEPNPSNMLNFQQDKIRKFLYKLDDMDVYWKSYCTISMLLSDYIFFERPALLLNQMKYIGLVRKFRKYVGSRERVDDTALFLLEFMRLQVEFRGRAYISKSSFFGPDFEMIATQQKQARSRQRRQKRNKLAKSLEEKKEKVPQILAMCHKIADRILQLQQADTDYIDWLNIKFRNFIKTYPTESVVLTAMVNVNSFDPTFSDLQKRLDSWHKIREFLGLSDDCTFPDGCIPKGWRPASDDADDLQKISYVRADGYYYYADGTQRRGKWHYSTNKYLIIKCSPQNFGEYKPYWDDPRLLSGRPNWDEYTNNGLFPGIWDESGKNISEFKAINNVRWRKG